VPRQAARRGKSWSERHTCAVVNTGFRDGLHRASAWQPITGAHELLAAPSLAEARSLAHARCDAVNSGQDRETGRVEAREDG
jgi:hypothetical protein